MRVRNHLRSNAIGYVALFVALSGTAYAANTISSTDIINGEVKSPRHRHRRGEEHRHPGRRVTNVDFLNNDLRSNDVRNGTLLSEDINDNELTGTDVADGQPRWGGHPRREPSARRSRHRLGRLVGDRRRRGRLVRDRAGHRRGRRARHRARALRDGDQHRRHDGTRRRIRDRTAIVACGFGEDLLSTSVDWTNNGGHFETVTTGVNVIDRTTDPETANVSVAYDGGAARQRSCRWLPASSSGSPDAGMPATASGRERGERSPRSGRVL